MPGSFNGSRDQLEAKARDAKEQKILENFQKNQDSTAEAKEESKEDARATEIRSRLPEKVPSLILGSRFGDDAGFVPYATFKDHYKTIWDQIADKDQLISQRTYYSTKIGPHTFTFRSLTGGEQRALVMFDNTDYSTLRIILQLAKQGTTDFTPIRLTPETRQKWRDDPFIKQQYDWILDWDISVISHVLGVLNDLDRAKEYALVEDSINP